VGGLVGASDVAAVYRATINPTTGNMGAFSTNGQSQLPQPLEDHQVIVQKIGTTTYIYVIGGENGGVIRSSVYRAIIDETTGNIGSFSAVNQSQLPALRARHKAVNAAIGTSNYIYVLGGSDGSIVLTVYKAPIN